MLDYPEMYEKYKQLSIYDFLNGESQEDKPSETVPQVDEAQEITLVNGSTFGCSIPSSALDTDKLINENLVFNPDGYAEKVVEIDCNPIPIEDTDKTCDDCHGKTLFSVGNVLTVRQASDVYSADENPEDFYYLKNYEGEQVKVLNIRGDLLLCNTFNLDKNIWLRSQELQKNLSVKVFVDTRERL
ncbi:hypothetical protein BMBphi_gp023 [Bacillus phage vB_BthS_BMBphi]|nr:hypothetical protein BMBphi_gp023 [Bacillus phage vB_BthS_BMBphi]